MAEKKPMHPRVFSGKVPTTRQREKETRRRKIAGGRILTHGRKRKPLWQTDRDEIFHPDAGSNRCRKKERIADALNQKKKPYVTKVGSLGKAVRPKQKSEDAT